MEDYKVKKIVKFLKKRKKVYEQSLKMQSDNPADKELFKSLDDEATGALEVIKETLEFISVAVLSKISK